MECEYEINLQSIQSRIAELSDFLSNSTSASATESDDDFLIQQCLPPLQSYVDQIVSDHCDVVPEHLDAYMNRLNDELRNTEAEAASLSNEIENLKKLNLEGTSQLEGTLESLRHIVDYAKLEGIGQGGLVDKVKTGDGQPQAKAVRNDYFEIFKLKDQIEKNKITLKSLEDLDLDLKRIEAIEYIEEAVTGLKVMDFEGNTIRVSMRTYIPDIEDVMRQTNAEDQIKQSEVNHELLIEVIDGTMEVKNVEIFPNDVYLGDIVEAADTFRKVISPSVPQTRSSLGWFLQKAQDRIVMCTLRQLMVKIANQSRHSFEYLDKGEVIVAHLAGSIDAFIKPSQGWPRLMSPLKLVSFRSSDQNAKEISLSLFSEVEEVASSFDLNMRNSITNFVDGIEEILSEKLGPELLS